MKVTTTIKLDTQEINNLLTTETLLLDICNMFTACNNCPFKSKFEICPHKTLKQAIDLLQIRE